MNDQVAHSFLLVDADVRTRQTLTHVLTSRGHTVKHASTLEEAGEQASSDDGLELVLVDDRVPKAFELIRSLRLEAPNAAIIAVLTEPSLDCAVSALKCGADDCVFRPLEVSELFERAERAMVQSSRRAPGLPGIVGSSPELDAIREMIVTVAKSPVSCVLITGESGTGKDLVAHAIHGASTRAAGPFVNITCTALPETLLESELFGHEPGSFTGANRLKRGLFELADGGTVFLDEIGDMTPSLQAKLLRFTEERSFRRVGGTRDIQVDVRVIAATHRDLTESVGDGSFREDLYYRLQVVCIDIPPLRQRAGDVPVLARHFVEHFAREFGKPAGELEPAVLDVLSSHTWPGNVRELKHVIERAVLVSTGGRLTEGDVSIAARRARTGFKLPPQGVVLEDVERDLLLQALEQTGWHCTRAGRLLGLNRDQVRYRIDKFQLTPPSGVEASNGDGVPISGRIVRTDLS